MKQHHILFIICLLHLSSANAQTTFDWDTNSIDNGDNVTETINGITATFTGPTIATTTLDVNGFGGSSGNIVVIDDISAIANEVTFSFSEPIDVISILALEGNAANIDYTFSPIGGTNSPITESLTGGIAAVTLNWYDVTSFTVTSVGAWYGFDDLIISSNPLSTNDFKLKTLKIYPNPTSDFIMINGLTTKANYEIYNTIGQKVKRGVVLENEKIDIQNLTNGIYVLKLGDGNRVRFIKE